jgi:hypothetical protein
VNVRLLLPDVAAPPVPRAPTPGGTDGGFGALVDAVGATLRDADAAERAFAAHRGGLQEMVVERVRADLALQIAAATAQRITQGVQTLVALQL